MKKLILAAICALGFSTSALAEKVMCVDKQHKQHTVEFIDDFVEFVYMDKMEYNYVGETKDGTAIKYSSDKHDITFIVDKENRDWFFLIQTVKAVKKGQKPVEVFYALCDNVNVIQEEQQPQLVLNK